MDLSIFEAIMLLCFGLAWPFSIIRSVKSRSTKGKSLFFLIIIETGYISGTIHKLIYSTDLVMVLYILNGLMVLTDIVLYFINRRKEINEAQPI